MASRSMTRPAYRIARNPRVSRTTLALGALLAEGVPPVKVTGIETFALQVPDGAHPQPHRLYRYADPMGALNLAVMGEGERLHWHFDQTDFVTSIALRPSEAGGDFEYVPLIRSAIDEN